MGLHEKSLLGLSKNRSSRETRIATGSREIVSRNTCGVLLIDRKRKWVATGTRVNHPN